MISYPHGLEKLMLLKGLYFPRQSTVYTFNTLRTFFTDPETKRKENENIKKVTWKQERAYIA